MVMTTTGTEKFIEKAKKVHGSKYDYSEVVFVNNLIKVKIICPDHGPFLIPPTGHSEKKIGCPDCINKVEPTRTEIKVEEPKVIIKPLTSEEKKEDFLMFIIGLQNEAEWDFTTSDFSEKTGYTAHVIDKSIAFNLIILDEAENKHRTEFLKQIQAAEKEDIHLVQIFEDEWFNNRALVEKKIRHLLGMAKDKVFARELTLKPVPSGIAKIFYTQTHIQGPGLVGSQSFGLYKDNELIACMTFGHNRFEKNNDGTIEIFRYASTIHVVGGASRLLTNYIKQYPEINNIISYADRRWSKGNLYRALGFQYAGNSTPGYYYVKDGKRYNRQLFMKHLLAKKLEKFDLNVSESENMNNNGYSKVYDCGTSKWELKLN